MNFVEIKLTYQEYHALRNFTIERQAYFASFFKKASYSLEDAIVSYLLDFHFYFDYNQKNFLYNTSLSFTIFEATALKNILSFQAENVLESVRIKLEKSIDEFTTHDDGIIVGFDYWHKMRISKDDLEAMDDTYYEVLQEFFIQEKMAENIKNITKNIK